MMTFPILASGLLSGSGQDREGERMIELRCNVTMAIGLFCCFVRMTILHTGEKQKNYNQVYIYDVFHQQTVEQ